MSRLHARRIYILGASGTGTTTLGKALSDTHGAAHVDCDDHLWAPVEPPYSVRIAPQERIASMSEALGAGGWILSGACHDWGGALATRADLIVFLSLCPFERIRRLRAREKARFGRRIEAGGDMYDTHRAFIRWTRGYDARSIGGRNRAAHEDWLAQQPQPVCRINAAQPVAASVEAVMSALQRL
jgi:adenylate kinase family enzyme